MKDGIFEIIKTDGLSNRQLLDIVVSGCVFAYNSYDHAKAEEEFIGNDGYNQDIEALSIFGNGGVVSCYDLPDELKEKHKVWRIGKIRQISFAPNGEATKFIIGARYFKTYYMDDFGVNVFPLKEMVK